MGVSAWYMYPPLVIVFLSKFRATGSLISYTPISMYLPTDLHKLHVYCGFTIFVSSLVHTFCHIARWVCQKNVDLLFRNASGVSGCVLCLTLFLICIPMINRAIRYEIRKNLHYFFIVFMLA